MSRFVASALLVAALIPACVVAEGELEDESLSETEDNLGRVTVTRIMASATTTAYASTSRLRARLLSANDAPLASKQLVVYVDGFGHTVTTDTNGYAVFESDFTQLGAPAAHSVVWKFAGDGPYGASNTTTELKIIRSDCAVDMWANEELSNAKQKLVARLVGRKDATWAPLGGRTIEFRQDGAVLGTATTDAYGTAYLSVTPSTPTGTIVGDFAGEASYAACSDADDYVLSPYLPPASLTLTASKASATMGDTVKLTASLYHLDNGLWTPMANTPVKFGDGLGVATTNSNGVAVLDAKLTNAVGAASVEAGDQYIDAQPLANVGYGGYGDPIVKITIAKGAVDITGQLLGLDSLFATYKWTVKRNGAPVPGLVLTTPCGDNPVNNQGTLTCTFMRTWAAKLTPQVGAPIYYVTVKPAVATAWTGSWSGGWE